MNQSHTNTVDEFFGKRIYIVLAAIAGIPIFLGTEAFVKSINVSEDEAVSFAVTICIIAGVFSGRYIAQIWTSKTKSIPASLFILLALLVVACIAWIFFHADFPLQDREAINLILFWIPVAIASLGTGMLIKLLRAITQKELLDAKTSAAQSQSELHLLQSQLSPHFLFNTLNNLYGLSITQHEKIPALLLKLSELLRYSVYESNELFVSLKDEIAYINNYIEFEKIRIGNRLVITTDMQKIEDPNIKIAPMLLIVFIENAFKHAKNTAEQQIFIDMSLKIWGNSILFSIKNSHTISNKDNSSFDKNSGFGLVNVSKRLKLLYPNKHILEIQNENETYQVMLQLKMK